MATRKSMVGLVEEVQRLIDDRDEATWSFQDVQDALDDHRGSVAYLGLNALPTIYQGGSVEYYQFVAPQGYDYWEGTAGLTFLEAGYGTLTNCTQEDWRHGSWRFGSAPNRPVMLSGCFFDVYGAAADLLERWPQGTAGDDIDTKEGIVEYKFSQRKGDRKAKADQYRARSWATCAEIGRSDG